MLFMAFLGDRDRRKDFALLTGMLKRQIAVHRCFGAFVGQVPAPPPQIGRRRADVTNWPGSRVFGHGSKTNRSGGNQGCQRARSRAGGSTGGSTRTASISKRQQTWEMPRMQAVLDDSMPQHPDRAIAGEPRNRGGNVADSPEEKAPLEGTRQEDAREESTRQESTRQEGGSRDTPEEGAGQRRHRPKGTGQRRQWQEGTAKTLRGGETTTEARRLGGWDFATWRMATGRSRHEVDHPGRDGDGLQPGLGTADRALSGPPACAGAAFEDRGGSDRTGNPAHGRRPELRLVLPHAPCPGARGRVVDRHPRGCA